MIYGALRESEKGKVSMVNTSAVPERKKPDMKLYYWKYDDGSWDYAVCDLSVFGKKRYLLQGNCSRKKELNKFLTDQKDQYEKREKVVIRKKLKIPAGIFHLEKDRVPKRDTSKGDDGVKALVALIESCGVDVNAKREMLRLVSAILAGYCARVCYGSYQGYVSPTQLRAPVVNIKYHDYTFLVLDRIVSALSFNTIGFGRLEIEYAPVLPVKVKDRKITDSAYLELSGNSERQIPQYRDTVLLVNGRFYMGAELTELQRRNLWVSLILFACTAKKKALCTPIQIKGDILAKCDCSWKDKPLKFVVARYVNYLARYAKPKKKWDKKVKNYFSRLESMLSFYNQQPDAQPVRRQEKYQIMLQMLALRLFLNACVEDGDINSEEGKTLRKEWYNILLPGCCAAPDEDEFDAVENTIELQQQFENGMSKMLKEFYPQKFLFVPEGAYCDRTDPENENETYWGYIRWYKSKKKNKNTQYLCLQFRKEQLVNLLDRFCGKNLGEDIYRDLWKLDVDYIHDVRKARLYADQHEKEEKKSIEALTLFIESMDFLPAKLREEMQKSGERLRNKTG